MFWSKLYHRHSHHHHHVYNHQQQLYSPPYTTQGRNAIKTFFLILSLCLSYVDVSPTVFHLCVIIWQLKHWALKVPIITATILVFDINVHYRRHCWAPPTPPSLLKPVKFNHRNDDRYVEEVFHLFVNILPNRIQPILTRKRWLPQRR